MEDTRIPEKTTDLPKDTDKLYSINPEMTSQYFFKKYGFA
jgi:hypothetical protein